MWSSFGNTKEILSKQALSQITATILNLQITLTFWISEKRYSVIFNIILGSKVSFDNMTPRLLLVDKIGFNHFKIFTLNKEQDISYLFLQLSSMNLLTNFRKVSVSSHFKTTKIAHICFLVKRKRWIPHQTFWCDVPIIKSTFHRLKECWNKIRKLNVLLLSAFQKCCAQNQCFKQSERWFHVLILFTKTLILCKAFPTNLKLRERLTSFEDHFGTCMRSFH